MTSTSYVRSTLLPSHSHETYWGTSLSLRTPNLSPPQTYTIVPSAQLAGAAPKSILYHEISKADLGTSL